jgi:hypothetical protein
VSFSEIAAGTSFACGRSVSSTVYCWGDNSVGQMGQGSLGLESLRPIPVQGALAFRRVAVGQSHSCGLATDSTAWCWGRNREGQLGAADSAASIAPRPVAGGLHFASLTLGYTQSCGLTAAGTAYCWGAGRPAMPSTIQPGTVFLTLASSPVNRVCGVRADSTVVCIAPPAGPTAPRGARPAGSPPLSSESLRPHRRTRGSM